MDTLKSSPTEFVEYLWKLVFACELELLLRNLCVDIIFIFFGCVQMLFFVFELMVKMEPSE